MTLNRIIWFYWVGHKVSLVFKQKYKTDFSLSPSSLLNNKFSFVPLPSAIFQATSQFYLPPIFYLLEQRTVAGAFYSLPGNGNCFSLRKLCKDRNKWTFEGAMSGEYGGWIRTVAVFAWLSVLDLNSLSVLVTSHMV